MRKPSPIIMSAVKVPQRPSKGRLARAFAHRQLLRPNLTKALRSMGEARGFKVVGRELDLDIVGGIGTGPGRVSALDVEMRLAANPRIEKISINLNSPGGDVLQAQRIYNALRSHGAFVEVTVDQQCASAANQILPAGDLRQAWFGSEIMLHSAEITPALGTRLTAETHRRLALEVEKTNGLIIDLCVARTGTTRARFEREFRDERSMTLPTAISLGLIHAMVGDVEWKQGRPYYW